MTPHQPTQPPIRPLERDSTAAERAAERTPDWHAVASHKARLCDAVAALLDTRGYQSPLELLRRLPAPYGHDIARGYIGERDIDACCRSLVRQQRAVRDWRGTGYRRTQPFERQADTDAPAELSDYQRRIDRFTSFLHSGSHPRDAYTPHDIGELITALDAFIPVLEHGIAYVSRAAALLREQGDLQP